MQEKDIWHMPIENLEQLIAELEAELGAIHNTELTGS